MDHVYREAVQNFDRETVHNLLFPAEGQESQVSEECIDDLTLLVQVPDEIVDMIFDYKYGKYGADGIGTLMYKAIEGTIDSDTPYVGYLQLVIRALGRGLYPTEQSSIAMLNKLLQGKNVEDLYVYAIDITYLLLYRYPLDELSLSIFEGKHDHPDFLSDVQLGVLLCIKFLFLKVEFEYVSDYVNVYGDIANRVANQLFLRSLTFEDRYIARRFIEMHDKDSTRALIHIHKFYHGTNSIYRTLDRKGILRGGIEIFIAACRDGESDIINHFRRRVTLNNGNYSPLRALLMRVIESDRREDYEILDSILRSENFGVNNNTYYEAVRFAARHSNHILANFLINREFATRQDYEAERNRATRVDVIREIGNDVTVQLGIDADDTMDDRLEDGLDE